MGILVVMSLPVFVVSSLMRRWRLALVLPTGGIPEVAEMIVLGWENRGVGYEYHGSSLLDSLHVLLSMFARLFFGFAQRVMLGEAIVI